MHYSIRKPVRFEPEKEGDGGSSNKRMKFGGIKIDIKTKSPVDSCSDLLTSKEYLDEKDGRQIIACSEKRKDGAVLSCQHTFARTGRVPWQQQICRQRGEAARGDSRARKNKSSVPFKTRWKEEQRKICCLLPGKQTKNKSRNDRNRCDCG